MFKKHGLTGQTKHRVFEALLERQQGKCGICGISLAELQIQCANQPQQRRDGNVHYLLYIDHCHTTGMIRGLLCVSCNIVLSHVENYGFKPKPETIRTIFRDGRVEVVPFTDEFFDRMIERTAHWLNQYKEQVLEYMQQERWLPRRDILSHLQGQALPRSR